MEIRIASSRHGHCILELMNELSQMPEFELYSHLMSLNTSIYILDKNFQELEAFVRELTSNPKHRDLFDVENRHLLHRVSEDVVRRIHNFVAAVASLRDHTRRMYQTRYEQQGLMPHYPTKVSDYFIQDPISQFVQELREYFQHYQSPHLNYVTAWRAGTSPPTTTAIILKDDLLTYGNWSPPVLHYIEGLDRGADILQVTLHYRDKALAFLQWFQTEQARIHQADLSRFRQKEGELLRLQLEDKLDRCLASGDPRDRSESALFFHMFTKPEYDQLAECPARGPRRIETAIDLLSQRFEVTPELEARLRQAYRRPMFRFYESMPRRGVLPSRIVRWIRQDVLAAISKIVHPPRSAA